MEYIVNLLTLSGNSRYVTLEAEDVKEADRLCSEKYPTCSVMRITSSKENLNYFNSIKKMKE